MKKKNLKEKINPSKKDKGKKTIEKEIVQREGVRSTVCRESFLALASESLAWTKVRV